MIDRSYIQKVLNDYSEKTRCDETLEDTLTISTINSHSHLQIFHGAHQEGLGTLGIRLREGKQYTPFFPLARPSDYITVDKWPEILNEKNQALMLDRSSIVIPHGSFVAYVGAENIKRDFGVPMLGNRESLEWENDRKKQEEWLKLAGLKIPQVYKSQKEAGKKVFVKYPGAKGGSGYFTANSDVIIEKRINELVTRGKVSKEEASKLTLQEFLVGNRYYPHYFFSLTEDNGLGFKEGRIELMGMDRRIEPIDESYRDFPNVSEEFQDYEVTGNQEVIVREKLLADIMKMGVDTVKASQELFPPGITGPFCLETVYHPEHGFTVFEISGRIVAGTNLHPMGSPYSAYFFDEPMSTGRRIAREIKKASKQGILDKVVY